MRCWHPRTALATVSVGSYVLGGSSSIPHHLLCGCAAIALHRRSTCGSTLLFVAALNGHVLAVTALVAAGACPNASDAVWWIDLIVRAVERDEEAVTALVAAGGQLTRRLNENGHFARTTVKMAELAHPAAEALRLALTRA